MMFRDNPLYKSAHLRFNNAVEYWYTTVLEDDGLEELMLASFNLSRTIRTYCAYQAPEIIPVQIHSALMWAIESADNSNGIKPLQFEARNMEALSRSVYRALKLAGRVIKEDKNEEPTRTL